MTPPLWAMAGGVLAAGLFEWSSRRWQRHAPPGLLPALLAGWWAAIALGVPETDHLIGVGLLVGGLALAELAANEHLPPALHLATAAAVVWSGLYGAAGQTRALLVALCGVAVILVPAAVVSSAALRSQRQLVISALSVLVVLVASRLSVTLSR